MSMVMTDEVQRGNVISTGNSEIDKKLGGGIPRGSLTLIEGQSDAGKSVLTQQMVWGSLNNKFTVSMYTTENTIKSLLNQMESLSLDVLDYFLIGKLNIYPIKTGGKKLTGKKFFRLLLKLIREENDRDLVIIDSLTTFIIHATVEDTISFFEECKIICSDGLSIINVVHSYAFDESTLIRIRSMCDAHLRLRLEEVGDRLIKVLEVAKVRGADKVTGNIISFDVEPGLGMRIIPILKAKA